MKNNAEKKLTRAERRSLNKTGFALARVEDKRVENDVAAVLDPYREQELLPPGLVNGQTLRRMRGERTDADCINEVCELVASGITCKAARRYVGVPTTTWKSWRRDNVANVKEKYALARECQLEEFIDDTIEIFEELKQQREDALKRWREELKV